MLLTLTLVVYMQIVLSGGVTMSGGVSTAVGVEQTPQSTVDALWTATLGAQPYESATADSAGEAFLVFYPEESVR